MMRLLLFYIFLIFTSSCNSHTAHSHAPVTKKDSILKSNAYYFQEIQQNDQPLKSPLPGEWLYEHPENGQRFEDYKKSNPTKITAEKSIIYLQPIGRFTPLQLKLLEATREYVQIFFQQKTILSEPVNDSLIPPTARRTRSGHEQLLSPYLMDSVLYPKIPANAFALMAITEKDLYPEESWNFVFGQASYTNRVGVSSIYRLEDYHLTEANFTLCLKRLINTAAHEIGHMYSMPHCTFAQCIMNGSNSLTESDHCPNRLCSECQKKLSFNINYDNRKRLEQLLFFVKKHDLKEDYRALEPDGKALDLL